MKSLVTNYNQLIENIGDTLQRARENSIKAINTELVKANWEIGRHIVEFEQNGKKKKNMEVVYLALFPKI